MCHEKFAYKRQIQKHIQQVHKKLKSYKCDSSMLPSSSTNQNIQTADCSPVPQHPQHLTDECEVLLSGLPLKLTLTDKAILDKTLSNKGLPLHTRFITRTRSWIQKNQSKNSNSSHTRSLVFKCSSPLVRDTIISCSHKLSNIRTQSLFNTDGEDNDLYLRPFWPKPVRSLYTKALSVSRELNYPKPFVRNLTVLIRKQPNSPPIPIHSEKDLKMLSTSLNLPSMPFQGAKQHRPEGGTDEVASYRTNSELARQPTTNLA
ncbi:hypothetical protein TKK_0004255 [Trichogramma kaykai]